MVEKYRDIFKSLKSCPIMPPQNLFKKIWCAITGQSNSDFQHSPMETAEPVGIDSDISEEYSVAEREVFKSLQNYSVTPPAFSTLKIGDTVANKEYAYPGKKNTKIIGFKYFGRIAAAAVIIGFGIWLVNSYKSHRANATTALSTPQKEVLPVVNNSDSIKTNISNNNRATERSLIAKATTEKHTIKRELIEHVGKINTSATFNSKTKLVDNDILLTLVSYKYSDYLPLLSEIKKNNTIRLDQFSYVTISDKMNKVLKKMYATNRRNKPTRKARRLKANLEKWKKADEKHFDANPNNNPVDIIDLSEFILK